MFLPANKIAVETSTPLLTNKHNAMFPIVRDHVNKFPHYLQERLVRNLQKFEQKSINLSDYVVFQSREDIKKFDIPQKTKSYVIPNGTDYKTIEAGGDPEQFRRELNIDKDSIVVIFVGSYDYSPNYEAAIQIRDHFAPQFSDIQFILAGRNPPKTNQHNIHTPGFVEDLPGLLNLADIALVPLKTGAGTKLKMLDFLAAGLPIVTTSVGIQGIDVVDGESVIVEDDIRGMINSIDYLASSPKTRERFSREAKIVGKRYSWEKLLSKYENIIMDIK
jgi:glycosyltransferase involved in cell wall biosynthesis